MAEKRNNPKAAAIKMQAAREMLKVGGENIAASEIEQVIALVPGVREAALLAKTHPMLDEVPVVFIIPQGGVAGAAPDLHDRVMAACRRPCRFQGAARDQARRRHAARDAGKGGEGGAAEDGGVTS